MTGLLVTLAALLMAAVVMAAPAPDQDPAVQRRAVTAADVIVEKAIRQLTDLTHYVDADLAAADSDPAFDVDVFKYQLIHCDNAHCDAYCKTRPGFNTGMCNHYQLCSCYLVPR